MTVVFPVIVPVASSDLQGGPWFPITPLPMLSAALLLAHLVISVKRPLAGVSAVLH